jgi:putative transposase
MKHLEKPGWHKRGYLPHFDANTLLQHVVFRTKDSLPLCVFEQLSSSDISEQRRIVDEALDKSSLGRVFDTPEFADIMEAALRYFDNDRYDLQAWCVKPNHIHVVFVTGPEEILGKIIQSWKQATALKINRILGRSGAIFARDYFDRFVRNHAQAERVVHYVETNPVKAGLCESADDCRWSSAYAKASGWRPNLTRLPVFDV